MLTKPREDQAWEGESDFGSGSRRRDERVASKGSGHGAGYDLFIFAQIREGSQGEAKVGGRTPEVSTWEKSTCRGGQEDENEDALKKYSRAAGDLIQAKKVEVMTRTERSGFGCEIRMKKHTHVTLLSSMPDHVVSVDLQAMLHLAHLFHSPAPCRPTIPHIHTTASPTTPTSPPVTVPPPTPGPERSSPSPHSYPTVQIPSTQAIPRNPVSSVPPPPAPTPSPKNRPSNRPSRRMQSSAQTLSPPSPSKERAPAPAPASAWPPPPARAQTPIPPFYPVTSLFTRPSLPASPLPCRHPSRPHVCLVPWHK